MASSPVAGGSSPSHVVALVQPLYQVDPTPTRPSSSSTSKPRDDVVDVPTVATNINVTLISSKLSNNSTADNAAASSSRFAHTSADALSNTRKRSPSPPAASSAKRIKTEDGPQTQKPDDSMDVDDEIDELLASRPHLFTTSCLYHLDGGDQYLSEEGRLGPVQLSVQKRSDPQDADEEAFFAGERLEVKTQDGATLLTVPVLRTMDDRFPLKAEPWRTTCGEWLLSAARLVARGVIEWDVEASLETGGSVLRLDIDARLGPSCSVRNDAATDGAAAYSSLRRGDAADLAYIVRFASVDSGIEEERHRRRGIDASAIYANLCPARVDGPPSLQPAGLEATLLPFQRRSAAFILGREGKQLLKDSTETQDVEDRVMTNRGWSERGLWWQRIREDLYYNAVTGQFAQSLAATRQYDVKGALLAEEMGLGKTVEVLALVNLNPSPQERNDAELYMDEVNEVEVKPVKTTLIVAPDVLVEQWADEVARHSPTLSVYVFNGRHGLKKAMGAEDDFRNFASKLDVIVASFRTVQGEFDIAQKERPRSRRFPRQYERPRSPLIVVEFWRVVCDEIQMVGNTTKAAEVVSMIPRQSSLAVSGTPIKRLEDLGSFFRFLRLPDAASILYKSPAPAVLAPALHEGLNALTTRHLKSGVKDEMTLPPQRRFIMPIDFTVVEQAYYDEVWQSALAALGMDSSGAPLRGDWQLDEAAMRSHLLLLRQACTHPQIAGRVLGSGTLAEGNLRSITEVLVFMKDKAAANLAVERNHWGQRVIDRAVTQLQGPQDEGGRQVVLAALEGLVKTLQSFCETTRNELVQAKRVGPGYEFKDDEIESEDSRSRSPAGSSSDDADAGEAREQTAKRQARSMHLIVLAQRNRSAIEVLARATHWMGNVCYQINDRRPEGTEEDASLKAKEDEAYKAAEALRQELLKEAKDQVDRRAESTKKTQIKASLNEMSEDQAAFEHYGIQTADIVAQIKERLALLDKNAALLMEWRKAVLECLYAPVNRDVSEENADDDQYAEALDTQHKAEVILELYRPLLAERQRILTYEVAVGSMDKPAGFKELELAVEAAKRTRRQAMLRGEISKEEFDADHDGLSVLSEVDSTKLQQFRDLEAAKADVSLRSLSEMVSLKDLMDRLRGISDSASATELAIARKATTSLRAALKHQNGILESLRRELDGFAKLFNQRAEYFKQLQVLSDALVDLPVAADQVDAKIARLTKEVDTAATKMTQSESRVRYLEHLGKIEEDDIDEAARKCVVCTDEIVIGILAAGCGHVVCQSCFNAWHAKHGTCPICRGKIGPLKDQHKVKYSKPGKDEDGEMSTEVEGSQNSQTPAALARPKKVAFNVAPLELQRRIESTTSLGKYGSKLDMLVRHLIHISTDSPGEKTIVFSAFARGLTFVADALRQNGVAHVSVTKGGVKGQVAAKVREFTQGSKVDVLLLHSEQTSAGLNLMATKNVILLEPLVNSGAERQALGRVHRIGQTKETNVFCYFVKDSVEERILHLAAHRGQSLYLKPSTIIKASSDSSSEGDDDSGALIASTTGSTAGSTREKGDYVNSVDDLLSCFFAEHLGGTRGGGGGGGGGESSRSGGGSGGGSQSNGAAPEGSTRTMSDAEHARQARLDMLRRRELAEARSAAGAAGAGGEGGGGEGSGSSGVI